MAASGFAALGYQILWTQQVGSWLGHEAAAVLAVVVALFLGLAGGAWLCDRGPVRTHRPARVYAACEAVMAGWAGLVGLQHEAVGRWLLSAIGPTPSALWHGTVAFGGTTVLLLPAALAMGATLPALERALATLAPAAHSRVPALYAANTAGAVLGVLAAAFWLMPAGGLLATAGLCMALNLGCAAWALLRLPDRTSGASPGPAAPAATGNTARRPLALLALTGALGIGHEVLVVRVLGQVSENTVYTFAMLLALYLLGTAAGAALLARSAPSRPAAWTRDRLLLAMVGACLLGLAGLAAAPAVQSTVRKLAGPGAASALAAEAASAALAFLPPTLVMGALFSQLMVEAGRHRLGTGSALAANTLGGAAAPLVFGLAALTSLGSRGALLLLPLAYLGLVGRPAWRRPGPWAALVAVLAAAMALPSLHFVDLPPGGRLLSLHEGTLGTVSVVEDPTGVRRLHIDNRAQEGSNVTGLADARQGLLPLLLHPAPRQVLFLGLGTGTTATAAADAVAGRSAAAGGLDLTAVELLPEVVAAGRWFREAPWPPNLRVIAADARRHVRTSVQRHDVIVSDNFHPARRGSAALYTVEHFRAVRERLAPGGLFCQWLPLHQLDRETLRSIVASFVAVYPGASAWLATNSLDTPVLGLVGRADDGRLAIGPLRQGLQAGPLAAAAQRIGVADDLALFGGFVAASPALRRLAGDAPLNTDRHPIVAYRAPRATYGPQPAPRERLLALLAELALAPEELLDTSAAGAGWAPRLAAYWRARDAYLRAGRDVQASADPARMLAQVGEPLLNVLRESPDFRPAYDPLLRLALALADHEPAAARRWLQRLAELQPWRGEAGQALRQLDP